MKLSECKVGHVFIHMGIIYIADSIDGTMIHLRLFTLDDVVYTKYDVIDINEYVQDMDVYIPITSYKRITKEPNS